MRFTEKYISTFLVAFALLFAFAFSSDALGEKENVTDKFYSNNQRLICISHRGNTVDYPENSLEAVKSALKNGADFVSVNLEKTADGVFYLCESEDLKNVIDASCTSLSQLDSSEVENYSLYNVYGEKTEYKMCSLELLLKKTDSKDGIILDVKSDDLEAVYQVVKNANALERTVLRVKDKGKSIAEWVKSKSEKVHVIGKYTGNIIFSTVSQVKHLNACEMPAVAFESKNYFNVCYGEFFTNRYLSDNYNIRAVASTYSPDLCGQRADGTDGWNELIGKGYSVIETDNVESFVFYRKETERLENAVQELLSRCAEIQRERYSQISLDNLKKAEAYCQKLISDSCFSLNEIQQAYSNLVFALEEMKISDGKVETRGALNITAGKVIAAILVGAALLCGQIYVYKMRRNDKKQR